MNLKRIKRAWQLSKENPQRLISLDEIQDDETVWDAIERMNLPKLREVEGDGHAEFIGEGTQTEYEEQLKEDKGLLPWYKRILRNEE